MIQLFKPLVSEEAINAVGEVLRSGWIGLGPKTAEFETAFCRYIGCKYAVAVNSASSGLHLAMLASGIKEGDEVLTVSLTFVSTNHAILYCGADPVFVDIDPTTLMMDLHRAERLVSARTKAIVVVHYGGNPCDLDALYRFAAKHNLRVIEDAAHACGAKFGDRHIGAFDGITSFSFHAVKNLPLGDGGMLTTNDEAIYKMLIKLRWMGIDRSTFDRTKGGYHWDYDVTELGYKYHMNDINAAIGIEHLKNLDEWNARRREIVRRYRANLASLVLRGSIRFVDADVERSSNHLCVIRSNSRNELVDKLKERGISLGVHYRPNHLYPMYHNARHAGLTETVMAYEEIASLPLHLQLTNEQVDSVSQAITEIVSR
jgi:perosamine synthetase